MSLGLGFASSHAPSMYLPAEKWPLFYEKLILGLPQPPSAQLETLEVIESYLARINKAHDILHEQLLSYKPDVLIVVGDDQGEVFSDALVPNMAIYLGETIAGTTNVPALGEPLHENHVQFRCDPELADYLLHGLTDLGFDIAYMKKFVPMGRPEAGLGHAFTRPGKAVLKGLDIPIVPFFLSAYHPPLASARRCFELGRAIRRLSDKYGKRVAIYGTGGLTHDPRGPRAGWIDEPLDRWILQQIGSGNNEALTNLFTFDSDTLRGGSGEIRSWITVAGAFADTPATVIDYFPAHHAVTGIGFACWKSE